MIIIKSKRTKIENISKKYPKAIILDITSEANDVYKEFSPFYPYGDIPIPYSNNETAKSVEGIWQGLKVFEHEGIDYSCFENSSMKNIKRTVCKHGRILGHQKGLFSHELLDYSTARMTIYIPSYKWVLHNKLNSLVEKLAKIAKKKTVVLLDYNVNEDVKNYKMALSHAALVKAYIEGIFPFELTEISKFYNEPFVQEEDLFK